MAEIYLIVFIKKNLKEDELKKTISYAKRNKLAKTRRGLSSKL